jgi:hypothetical protein
MWLPQLPNMTAGSRSLCASSQLCTDLSAAPKVLGVGDLHLERNQTMDSTLTPTDSRWLPPPRMMPRRGETSPKSRPQATET